KVGIAMIAGPPEVLSIADADNNPDWLAADLLAQAEHDTAAQAILITTSAALADAVEAAVARQLATLPRGAVAAAAWRDIADPAPYVAVNVSPVQLADPAFPATVARALAEAGLRPSSLELEVTESVLTVDPDAASARLAALRGLGVAIAIDDFGTGYSSLALLGRLPFTRLKVDRAFIAAADSN
ncbi:EAL domain-containing protein, partial [Mycobacterium tuberculosis]|nr:EAL domain-containing protein [Mycobacterium tuberculosis]